jgi:hypothetical protein
VTVQKEAALRVKRENPATEEYKSDTGLQKTDGYAVCISALTVFQSSGSVPVLTFFPSQ